MLRINTKLVVLSSDIQHSLPYSRCDWKRDFSFFSFLFFREWGWGLGLSSSSHIYFNWCDNLILRWNWQRLLRQIRIFVCVCDKHALACLLLPLTTSNLCCYLHLTCFNVDIKNICSHRQSWYHWDLITSSIMISPRFN